MSSFKSNQPNYRAIILPFESRWHDPVINGEVKAVFRKKGPSSKASPGWAYAYFGSPLSAICAKCEISEILRLTVSDALKYAKAGKLTEQELKHYAGDSEGLCVFRIGKVIVPKHAVGMAELFKRFGFRPTPSFVALSEDGIQLLDDVLKAEEPS